MTKIPSPSLTNIGFEVPSESDVFAGVFADINAAFGNALSTNLETPQGQIASTNTASIMDALNQFVALFNGIDPAFADGRMQDAICRLNFITRLPATPTLVVARCYGRTGVTIPAGSLAKAQDENVYASQADATIGSVGYADITFACTVTGPTSCPTGALNAIYRAHPGWDSVTNLVDGIPGTDVETRRALEARRQASVAAKAGGIIEAMRGAVLNAEGVTDAYLIDNPSNAPVTVNGVSVGAYQVYAAVKGGSDADVALALWGKKPPGIPWYSSGNTPVVITDDSPGYTTPYPTYTVKFNRPTAHPISFAIRIANNTLVPANAASLIAQAVVNAFKGLDDNERPTIASTVYASRFVAAIASVGSWCHVLDCFVGSPTTTNDFSGTASFANSVMTVTAVASGSLAVGDFITGVNAPPGARIVGLGTGTGGTGTYIVSTNQTAASGAVTGFKANQTNVASTMAQIPTLTAEQVSVNVV